MKISSKRLKEIVDEEVERAINELYEAEDDGNFPDVADAESDSSDKKKKKKKEKEDNDEKIPSPENAPDKDQVKADPKDKKEPAPKPKKSASKKEPQFDPEEDDDEIPELDIDTDDQTDDELADDEPAESDGSISVSDEVVGKTVQSITFESKSKLLPGASEVNITFNEITDELKILLTKTGKVAYYFRGMHNEV